MLRFVVVALLLANGGYFAWAQGWFAALGLAPNSQSESHRIAQQVRPESLRVSPVSAPDSTVSAYKDLRLAPWIDNWEKIPYNPPLCLQTNTVDEDESQKLQQVLEKSTLPPESWHVIPSIVRERWMVYIGKFPSETALDKRRNELRARKIAVDRAGGSFELGLSLGRFSNQDGAQRELNDLLKKGVSDARVVQERAPKTLHTIRFPQLTIMQRTALQALEDQLGKSTFLSCGTSAGLLS